MGGKYLPVLIAADGAAEQAETFTLELVSPTGGATLGDVTQATVQILTHRHPRRLCRREAVAVVVPSAPAGRDAARVGRRAASSTDSEPLASWSD